MKSFSLRRITSSGAYIREIDGLRFIAISSVIVFHLQLFLVHNYGFSEQASWFTRLLTENGGRGVQLFFAISGFILGLPWATHYLKGGPKVPLGGYFLRRITRLEPPYIISMLIIFAIYSLSGHHGQTVWFWFKRLCVSLLYFHNMVYGESSRLNSVAWSLEIEIQFYCLVPLITLIFAVRDRVTRRGVLVGTMLCAGLCQLLWRDSPRMQMSIASYLQFFLAGFLLADLFVTEWQDRESRDWSWDVIGVTVAPLLLCLDDNWFSVVGPFLVLVAYCAVFRGIWLKWLLTRPLITIPGGMCYSIYLLHLPIMAAALVLSTRFVKAGDYYLYFLLQLAAMAAVIGVFSTIFFLLIERPCMNKNWPQELWSRIHNGNRRGHTFFAIREESVQPQEMDA